MEQIPLLVTKFKNNDINQEFLNGCEEKSFGIIKLHANALNNTKIPLHLILTIDVSSSMEEEYTWNNKNYSKLDYVKATLKSIFSFLKNEYKDHDIIISLISFSDIAKVIESYIDLNKINLEYLYDIVDKLQAVGCTNIYDALKKATYIYESFDDYLSTQEKYKTKDLFKHVNILLTDGEITCGLNNPSALAEISKHNIIELQLLGYGTDHDSKLLKNLENLTNGEYRFVDSFEAAGAVYGDVLSSILHPAWKDIHIEIENGLLYNYKKNKWDTNLTIPRIGDKCEKILSCRIFDNVKILISYINITTEKGLINKDKILLEYNNSQNNLIEEDNQDIRCYWLRQITLELMNDIQQFRNDNNINEDLLILQQRQVTPQRNNIRGNRYLPRRVMRAQGNQNRNNNLIERVNKIINYIEKFEIDIAFDISDKNIELLKDLKDDLIIAKKCLTDENNSNEMYLNSRLTSQGSQRAYNINSNDLINISFAGTNTQSSNKMTMRQQARVSSHASPYAQRAMNQVAQLSQDFINSQDFQN